MRFLYSRVLRAGFLGARHTTVCLDPAFTGKKVDFMDSIGTVCGITRVVQRSHIFTDVMGLYKKGDIVGEYPIQIEFY